MPLSLNISVISGLILAIIYYVIKKNLNIESLVLIFIYGMGIIQGIGAFYYGLTGVTLLGQDIDDLRTSVAIGGLVLIIYGVYAYIGIIKRGK